jgi:hypothetical protein
MQCLLVWRITFRLWIETHALATARGRDSTLVSGAETSASIYRALAALAA